MATLAELREDAKAEAGMVENDYVSDETWDRYLNAGYKELHDLLVEAYGEDYFASFEEITAAGGSELFPLPVAFFKLLAIEKLEGDGRYRPVKKFSFTDREQGGRAGLPCRIRYRLSGKNLWLSPAPAAGTKFRLHFVPRAVKLLPTDEVDGINGWEEFMVVDAAIKARDSEESDCSVLIHRRDRLQARIQSSAPKRDAAGPATVVDTSRGRSGRYGYGYDPEDLS